MESNTINTLDNRPTWLRKYFVVIFLLIISGCKSDTICLIINQENSNLETIDIRKALLIAENTALENGRNPKHYKVHACVRETTYWFSFTIDWNKAPSDTPLVRGDPAHFGVSVDAITGDSELYKGQ